MKKVSLTLVAFCIVIGISFGMVVTPEPLFAKPVKIKLTIHFPDKPSAERDMLRRFITLVEEQTEGRVLIQPFFGAVLGKPADFLTMVGGSGVADAGYIISPYHAWEIPLWSGANLPFLWSGSKDGGRALWKLYNEWEPMQQEWEKFNVKPLFASSPHGYKLAMNKPIYKIEDLKGEKIYAGSTLAPLIEKFGAVNFAMSVGEHYDAAQKGVIDGTILGLHVFKVFGSDGVLKYFIDWGFAGGTCVNALGINMDVWAKIEPEDQKIIEQISIDIIPWFEDRMDDEIATFDSYYKDEKGVTYIELSDEDKAKVKSLAGDMAEIDYLEKCKKFNVPCDEFLPKFKAELKELSN